MTVNSGYFGRGSRPAAWASSAGAIMLRFSPATRSRASESDVSDTTRPMSRWSRTRGTVTCDDCADRLLQRVVRQDHLTAGDRAVGDLTQGQAALGRVGDLPGVFQQVGGDPARRLACHRVGRFLGDEERDQVGVGGERDIHAGAERDGPPPRAKRQRGAAIHRRAGSPAGHHAGPAARGPGHGPAGTGVRRGHRAGPGAGADPAPRGKRGALGVDRSTHPRGPGSGRGPPIWCRRVECYPWRLIPRRKTAPQCRGGRRSRSTVTSRAAACRAAESRPIRPTR